MNSSKNGRFKIFGWIRFIIKFTISNNLCCLNLNLLNGIIFAIQLSVHYHLRDAMMKTLAVNSIEPGQTARMCMLA